MKLNALYYNLPFVDERNPKPKRRFKELISSQVFGRLVPEAKSQRVEIMLQITTVQPFILYVRIKGEHMRMDA